MTAILTSPILDNSMCCCLTYTEIFSISGMELENHTLTASLPLLLTAPDEPPTLGTTAEAADATLTQRTAAGRKVAFIFEKINLY